MKKIIFMTLLLNLLNCSAQSTKDTTISNSTKIIGDSMIIINTAEIFNYTDENEKIHKAVKFQISVTNLSSKPIPNLQRADNRSRYLKLLIKNKDTNNSNINNGIESDTTSWVIKPKESDSFEVVYLLSEDLTLSTYGKLIAVKWVFMNVTSGMLLIDLDQMTISSISMGFY